jgi:hypothetical protein
LPNQSAYASDESVEELSLFFELVDGYYSARIESVSKGKAVVSGQWSVVSKDLDKNRSGFCF